MKIFVFAPHAAIWPLAFQQALVADCLAKAGHDVLYVSCGEAQSRFCIPMSAGGLTPSSATNDRAAVCALCKRNDERIRSGFKFAGPTLQAILTPQDLSDVERILGGLKKDTAIHLERDGVPIGRIALYQVLLRHKRFDLAFDEAQWSEYLIDLRHTIYSTIAARRMIETQKPDRILVYNGLYSINRVLCVLAEKAGIPAYAMHAGSNLAKRMQSVTVSRGDAFTYMPELLRQWRRFSNVPATPDELSASTDHILEQLRGQNIFVYSPAKSKKGFDARAHFKVRSEQKLLIATMSSNDEEGAGILVGAQSPRKNSLFASQVEWIQTVVEYVKQRPDLFLLIRVHPRDFPNRREKKKSQHAELLEASFVSLPKNVAVNWPSDGISLYDLLEQGDVFLNAWSSTGRDVPMMGIPVVIYSAELPWYPTDLNYVGETRALYFEAIERALAQGWSLELARRAYRWSAFELERATIFIGDGYAEPENPRRNLPQKVVHRVRRILSPDFAQKRDLRRRAPVLREANKVLKLFETSALTIVEQFQCDQDQSSRSLECETEALRVELRRLAKALFPVGSSRSVSRLFGRMTSCS